MMTKNNTPRRVSERTEKRLKDRFSANGSTSNISDIQRAREKKRAYQKYVADKNKALRQSREYSEKYDEYNKAFEEYKDERDDYIESLSEWADEETRQKERNEFLENYEKLKSKVQGLQMTEQKITGRENEQLKDFTTNINEEKQGLLSSEQKELDNISTYKKKIVSEIRSLSPLQRYQAGDPYVKRYEAYRNTWYLEDTGKRVMGTPVYRVIDYRYNGNLYPTSSAGKEIGKEFIGMPFSSETVGRGRKSNAWLMGKVYKGQEATTQSLSFDPFNVRKKTIPFIDANYMSKVSALSKGRQQLKTNISKAQKEFGYIPKSVKTPKALTNWLGFKKQQSENYFNAVNKRIAKNKDRFI